MFFNDIANIITAQTTDIVIGSVFFIVIIIATENTNNVIPIKALVTIPSFVFSLLWINILNIWLKAKPMIKVNEDKDKNNVSFSPINANTEAPAYINATIVILILSLAFAYLINKNMCYKTNDANAKPWKNAT